MEATTLGNNYRLGRRISCGETITSYAAERVGTDGFSRPVNVHVLHPHLSSNRRYARPFVVRARLFAELDHPAILPVEDVGRAAERLYSVTPSLRGASLSRILAHVGEQGLSARASCFVGVQLARALGAVHSVQLASGADAVFGGLTPEAVVVDIHGDVKLRDPAFRVEGDAPSSAKLRRKLKRFHAPERSAGARPTPRSDLYSLACLLWELLCRGQCARGALTASAESGVDPRLIELVVSGLSANVDDRPPSARAFCDQLLSLSSASLHVGREELGLLAARLAADGAEGAGDAPSEEQTTTIFTAVHASAEAPSSSPSSAVARDSASRGEASHTERSLIGPSLRAEQAEGAAETSDAKTEPCRAAGGTEPVLRAVAPPSTLRHLEPMRPPVRRAVEPAPPSPATPASSGVRRAPSPVPVSDASPLSPMPVVAVSAARPAAPAPNRRPTGPDPVQKAPQAKPAGGVRRAEEPAPGPRLVILPPGASGGLNLHGQVRRWVVGRGHGVDLLIDDADASREHFEVIRQPDGAFWLYDLGSKNGLRVNGQPTDEHRLRSHDEICAGNTRLRFEA